MAEVPSNDGKNMESKSTQNVGLLQPVYNFAKVKKETKENRKIVEESEKKLIKLRSQLYEAQQKGEEEYIKELKKQLDDEIATKRKAEKEIAEAKKKASKETTQDWVNAVASASSSLKSSLESTMNSFLEVQESMAYNLNGTDKTLSDVTDKLNNVLSGTGIVKQQAVYNNLTKLVQSGIVYNAEQRAYLETLSNDLGMQFSATNESLTRLINLQRRDLSSNRMAIEYSLKEFLNQNYQTSQYIKEGFEGVSNALIEAQSLMASDTAMELESVVQQWLGALSSVGMSSSTIQNLATAIGQLGSGDISSLSNSSMQNLLVMGASVSGQSYADLLTNGLTATTADKLLSGIVSYISSMSENTSNVVKSEYSRIFGLSVSDIIAASQVGNVTENGYLSSNIGNLLTDMSDYLYSSTKITNMMENFMYTWATTLASDSTQYSIYKIADLIGQATSALVGGVEVQLGFLGNGISTNLGTIASLAPLVATIPSLWDTLTGFTSNLASGGTNDALAIYKALAGNESEMVIKNSGLLASFSSTSGIEKSGSTIIANTNESDILKTTKTSATTTASQIYDQEDATKDINDVYNLLDEGLQRIEDTQDILLTDVKNAIIELPLQPFGTITRIAESANVVTIGNDITYLQDLMTVSALNIQNIYNLLYEYMKNGSAGNATVYSLSEGNIPFEWATSPAALAGDSNNYVNF